MCLCLTVSCLVNYIPSISFGSMKLVLYTSSKQLNFILSILNSSLNVTGFKNVNTSILDINFGTVERIV